MIEIGLLYLFYGSQMGKESLLQKHTLTNIHLHLLLNKMGGQKKVRFDNVIGLWERNSLKCGIYLYIYIQIMNRKINDLLDVELRFFCHYFFGNMPLDVD